MVGLIKNVDSHQNQENAVAQRGQNFHAKIAVSLFVGGGAGRDLKSEQTQRQRRHVRQHMARVSDQGQAVGQKSSGKLNYEKTPRNRQSKGESPLAGVVFRRTRVTTWHGL